MNLIAVPADLLQAVHSFLLSQKMGEVEAMVMALRQCQPVNSPRDEDPGNTASDRAESRKVQNVK